MILNHDPFKGVKAVAFDLDGTLYPDFRLWLGTGIPFAVRHLPVVLAMDRARKRMRAEGLGGDFSTVQAELTAAFLKTDPATAHARLKAAYAAWERIFSRVKPFRYMEDTLKKLKASGFPLAVMSDLPADEKLRAMGLLDRFDLTMTSEETGWLKPDPRPFLALADRLGLPPETVLYVGDSAHRDASGAAGVGMRTALISRKRKNRGAADFVFSRWDEFLSIVPESPR